MQKPAVPTLLAPAKINLTLEILGRRADGYHTLRSLMVPIALYDRIAIEPSVAPATTLEVDDRALASDNLIVRALAAARIERPFAIRLEKAIPVGGGLGGGSSDAAAILRSAMAGALGPIAADTDWNAAARSIGSDVPFFLCGTGALVEGTGERVTPVGALPAWWVVVAHPHAHVATADAYRLLAAIRERDGAPPTRVRAESTSLAAIDALQRGDFATLDATLANDFHEPLLAAYPHIAEAVGALSQAGVRRPLLSGSGSCVFALFETERAARRVEMALAPNAIQCAFTVPFHHDAAWR